MNLCGILWYFVAFFLFTSYHIDKFCLPYYYFCDIIGHNVHGTIIYIYVYLIVNVSLNRRNQRWMLNISIIVHGLVVLKYYNFLGKRLLLTRRLLNQEFLVVKLTQSLQTFYCRPF